MQAHVDELIVSPSEVAARLQRWNMAHQACYTEPDIMIERVWASV